MINGIVETYENNSMSLSCRGKMEIKNNRVLSVFYKGMPRANGKDVWMNFFTNTEKGDIIPDEDLDWVLSFNGKNNIVSVFFKDE